MIGPVYKFLGMVRGVSQVFYHFKYISIIVMPRQLEQPLDKKTWLPAQQQNRLHKVLVKCRIISNQILPFRMQIEGVIEPGV